jgi:hypothetical protein
MKIQNILTTKIRMLIIIKNREVGVDHLVLKGTNKIEIVSKTLYI